MTSTKRPLLVLLDSNALLHRAWHAIPPLTTKDGRVVNAAYGFTMALDNLLRSLKPDAMVAAWDLPGETFRHKAFAAYKAQRKEKEPELYAQIPIIQDILSAYGVKSLSREGYEADDVIGTLSREGAEAGYDVRIVTGDMDALQLVDERVQVIAFVKGISETKTYDVAAVRERYGFDPKQLIDYKALRGDASDNIPGVKGIGEKTGSELVAKYGSIEGMLAALERGEMEEKVAKKLRGAEATAREALMLVTIVRDVPLKFDLNAAKLGAPDTPALLTKFRDLEFRTLVKRLAGNDDVVAPPVDADPSAVKKTSKKESNDDVKIVRGTAQVDAALAVFNQSSVLGLLVVEQAPDLFGSHLSALVLSDGKHSVVLPSPSAEVLKMTLGVLKMVPRLVTHDFKMLLRLTGWDIEASKVTDTHVISYLLHAGTRAHDLPAVVKELLDVTLPELPTALTTDASYTPVVRAAALLPKLHEKAMGALDETGMRKLYEDIELPLVPILRHMEATGIAVDVKTLETFSKLLAERLDELTKKIHEVAGVEFNVNSPIQLSQVLFDTLALPTKGIKKTSQGFSTAASELEKLEDAHDIIPLISEYREYAKLQSTYAESLPKLVGSDGRIHTTYNQTTAATGRLSSVDPNLQNIPIKTDLGNEIRKAFVAGRGKKLLSLDYSQIELRLAAVIAKDEPFIKAFKDGVDIHTRTASEVWEVPEENVTGEQRRAAKAINFGILYGMGPRSLARSTGMSFGDAQQFIERYFQIHHAIRTYLDETKVLAHTQGHVSSLFGRRRTFPEINSGVPMLVATAERMAINMPIQGTAADLMKMAMISVDGWLSHSGWPADLLLQVHDELVIECEKDAVGVVARGVKQMMESVAELDVPLAVNVEVGDRWGEMEEWKG